jgi:hypothetical protein
MNNNIKLFGQEIFLVAVQIAFIASDSSLFNVKDKGISSIHKF